MAFFLNLAVLLLAAKQKHRVALFILLLIGGYSLYHLVKTGPDVGGITFFAESVLAGAVLVLCKEKQLSPQNYYYLGILPSVLAILFIFLYPVTREILHKEFLDSWRIQSQWAVKLKLYNTGNEGGRLVSWIWQLSPALWVLVGLGRIFFVRTTVGFILSDRLVFPKLKFMEFKVNQLFLWVFAAGLLCEVFSVAKINQLGYNLLLFTIALYVLQGFAVMQSLFFIRKTAFIYVFAFYALTFITQFPLIVVGTIGLFDVWFEFRNKIQKPLPQSE
jgi:hypothetical protein